MFGFVPARNKATRWIVHLRTEVFSLGAQYIDDVFYVLEPNCARRSRTRDRGYLGYRCTGAYSKAGLVGIVYTATGYD
ncbi:hypothetical protein AGR1A_pAt20271 [Agrobacterium fabacearum CFBP 5771]|nr:hypothetical protein AGR1A_pAt20271 [Agrobacterium fabacearum CFBP 5771]